MSFKWLVMLIISFQAFASELTREEVREHFVTLQSDEVAERELYDLSRLLGEVFRSENYEGEITREYEALLLSSDLDFNNYADYNVRMLIDPLANSTNRDFQQAFLSRFQSELYSSSASTRFKHEISNSLINFLNTNGSEEYLRNILSVVRGYPASESGFSRRDFIFALGNYYENNSGNLSSELKSEILNTLLLALQSDDLLVRNIALSTIVNNLIDTNSLRTDSSIQDQLRSCFGVTLSELQPLSKQDVLTFTTISQTILVRGNPLFAYLFSQTVDLSSDLQSEDFNTPQMSDEQLSGLRDVFSILLN